LVSSPPDDVLGNEHTLPDPRKDTRDTYLIQYRTARYLFGWIVPFSKGGTSRGRQVKVVRWQRVTPICGEQGRTEKHLGCQKSAARYAEGRFVHCAGLLINQHGGGGGRGISND